MKQLCSNGRKEGNDLFNDTLNTFYLQLYGVSCSSGVIKQNKLYTLKPLKTVICGRLSETRGAHLWVPPSLSVPGICIVHVFVVFFIIICVSVCVCVRERERERDRERDRERVRERVVVWGGWGGCFVCV